MLMGDRKQRLSRVISGFVRGLAMVVVVLVSVAVGMGLHAMLFGGGGRAESPAGVAEVWTCSMHPQIRKPGPGQCPICAMDLIPVAERGRTPRSPRELSVSPEAAALMDVAVAPVERRFVPASVRMVGKIDYDETKLAYVTARVGGRLDRLFVDYTGVPVRKGDHLAEIYSPELLTAQAELLQALGAQRGLRPGDTAVVRESVEAMLGAARGKLRLLGLEAIQIEKIESTGKVVDHLTIHSPAAGWWCTRTPPRGCTSTQAAASTRWPICPVCG